MKKLLFIFINFIIFLSCSIYSMSYLYQNWDINYIDYNGVNTRTGQLKTSMPVKGNVIYLEGLGDSMMNHAPLFQAVLEEGYNVIAFDYMGQGGSDGKMSNTTIKNIDDLALKVWHYYTDDEQMNLIGWSTGGLAAYRLAYIYPDKVSKIAMIAPGISPKFFVGDKMSITIESLTQERYLNGNDPHIDPIRPTSPLKVIPFSLDLLFTAHCSKSWGINPSVSGIVFLSSDKDTYVEPYKTMDIINNNAEHFDIVHYQSSGSLHELDNEIPEVSEDLRARVRSFLRD